MWKWKLKWKWYSLEYFDGGTLELSICFGFGRCECCVMLCSATATLWQLSKAMHSPHQDTNNQI